ncbi:hypothetical protein [Streptomyces virginiae]|uniref:hypothetical protein n=1 Tax=Streptomyces virginiae TaxID=1961 RepID=UPI0032482639
MNRPLPTHQQVRTSMETELDASRSAGRRATVSNVEKQLGVTHATFYRNYPGQIAWFKAQLVARREGAVAVRDTVKHQDDLDRLRRENTDLRKQLRIYAEAIRQLSMDKALLEDKLQVLTGTTDLDERRRQQDLRGVSQRETEARVAAGEGSALGVGEHGRRLGPPGHLDGLPAPGPHRPGGAGAAP